MTGSALACPDLVEGYASFKTLNSEMQPGPENWRYFTGFAGALTRPGLCPLSNIGRLFEARRYSGDYD